MAVSSFGLVDEDGETGESAHDSCWGFVRRVIELCVPNFFSQNMDKANEPTKTFSAPVLLAISSIDLSSTPSKVSKIFIRSADLSTAFATGYSELVSSESLTLGAVFE